MGNQTSSLLGIIKGSNITNSKNFGTIFKDELDIKYINGKNSELKNITNKNRKIPKIKKTLKVKLTNEEYMYLVKNFVNYFNENNKNRMSYLKKSFGMKFEVNEKYILYTIIFFCEFEDYKRTSRAQNILFLSFSEKGENFNFPSSILFAKILGEWASSDILMGNETEFDKKRFINIFRDEPIKYILDKNTIDNMLSNKEYVSKYYYERGFPEKKFKTEKPIYYKPKNNVKIKIGNKCLNVNNGVSFTECSQTKSLFNFLDNNKLQIVGSDNMCIAYHNDNNMSVVPCETLQNCGNSDLQSCQLFRARQYGGLEIVDKNRKCLTTSKTAGNCYETNKVSFI
jgi:hypothetical protein